PVRHQGLPAAGVPGADEDVVVGDAGTSIRVAFDRTAARRSHHPPRRVDSGLPNVFMGHACSCQARKACGLDHTVELTVHSHRASSESAQFESEAPMAVVHHVAVTVSDLDTSTPWYQALFGTDPVLDEDTDAGFRHVVWALDD